MAAGKANRARCKGLTPEGRERLREAALRHQPWRFATGPRTPEGKAQAARNGKRCQKGFCSVREARAEVAEVWALVRELGGIRPQTKTRSKPGSDQATAIAPGPEDPLVHLFQKTFALLGVSGSREPLDRS